MKKIYRKLSWVLLVAMLFSMLATGTVFAEDNELPAEPTVTEAPAEQETPEDAPVQSPVASAEPADTDPAPEEEPVVESTPVAEPEPEPLGDTMEYDRAATVNHIDIAVALKATITVNGTTETKTLKLTTADANNVSITASSGTFTRSGVSTSTDGSGHAQIRIKGTFPVGTKTNPINYTVSYSTSILVAGVSVPVTFAVTTNYWASDNVCPGLDRNWQNGSVAGGSGIDLALGTGTGSVATSGSMTIQKTVSGAALTADKTFVFDIYSGEKLYKTVSVTVKAGQTTAAALLTAVPFGTYTVREQTESAELDGYKVTVSGSDTVTLSSSNLSGAANIVNTYEEIPKYNKVVYSVSKGWNDADNNDGMRPASLEVYLLAGGEVVDTVTLSAANGWKADFAEQSVPIQNPPVYTVAEAVVPAGYTAGKPVLNGTEFTITNTHKLETTSITVVKKWDDGDNNDRSRPDSITVNLLADGEKVRSAEITAEDDWKVTFENLPFYKDGKKIVYTVTEEPVPGYTATIDDDDYVIINSYILKTVAYSVTKVWDDADNNDGKRPQSVTVNLLADGEPVDTVVLSEDNNWTAQFAPQKVYKDGVTVAYTVEEAEVPAGYTSATNLTDGGFTVTNTHKPETTEIQVKKVWADDNDNDGIRPDSVQIQLYADGEKVGEAVTMTDSYTFKDLPVYKAGEKIAYEVREENVAEGYTASYAEEDGVYVITNTHKSETRELTVTKKWDDQDDNDGIRPESVQIQLYADGVKLGDAVTMTDTYTFKDLPVSKDGKEIEYTVQEVNVASGYTASYEYKDGNVIITNTHKLETTTVAVTKTWVDNNNAKKARPDSITVQLYANGEKYGDAVAITKGMSWKYTFKDLPKYKDGKAVTYTVKETGVKHYVAKYSTKNDTITITNTYTDIPLTGDTINLLMWMLIVLAAGGALAGIGIFGHRKKSFGK